MSLLGNGLVTLGSQIGVEYEVEFERERERERIGSNTTSLKTRHIQLPRIHGGAHKFVIKRQDLQREFSSSSEIFHCIQEDE